MTLANPFEAFADAHTPRPVKARQRRATGAKAKSAKDKRIEERGRLATHYRREEARRTAEALASPQGKRLAALLAEFDRLTIDDADVMIARIESQEWLRRADEDFRRLALRLIDNRIGRIRRDAGLVELDDPLPGEPDNAFFIIKRFLMSAISIKSMLDAHVAANAKTWAHDRDLTVGASEIGQCLRKTWFAKNGVAFLFAGPEQKTLVDGYLSATSDGLLAGVSPDALSHHGIDDIGGDSLVVECKSIDPRVSLKDAKAEHAFQVHCQMGLIRHSTEYRPNFALISYTDASFLDDVTEFAIRFDPDIYAAAKIRATRIMTADGAMDLPPDGKLAGGGECRYRPHQSQCADVIVGAIPEGNEPLGGNALAALKALVDEEQAARAEKDGTARRHAEAQERIKEFLREHRTRKVEGDDWSVTYFPVKGRMSLDRKAALAAGIDLSPFEKPGDPGERLAIKVK